MSSSSSSSYPYSSSSSSITPPAAPRMRPIPLPLVEDDKLYYPYTTASSSFYTFQRMPTPPPSPSFGSAKMQSGTRINLDEVDVQLSHLAQEVTPTSAREDRG